MDTTNETKWVIKEMGKPIPLPKGDKEIMAIVHSTNYYGIQYVPFKFKNGKLVGGEDYLLDDIVAYTEFSILTLSSRPICIFMEENNMAQIGAGRFPINKNTTHVVDDNGETLKVMSVRASSDFPMIKVVSVFNENRALDEAIKTNVAQEKEKRRVEKLALEFSPLVLDVALDFSEQMKSGRQQIHTQYLAQFDLLLEKVVKPEKIMRDLRNIFGRHNEKDVHELSAIYLNGTIGQISTIVSLSGNKFEMEEWLSQMEKEAGENLMSLSEVALKCGIKLSKAKRILEKHNIHYFVCPATSYKGQKFIKHSLISRFEN